VKLDDAPQLGQGSGSIIAELKPGAAWLSSNYLVPSCLTRAESTEDIVELRRQKQRLTQRKRQKAFTCKTN